MARISLILAWGVTGVSSIKFTPVRASSSSKKALRTGDLGSELPTYEEFLDSRTTSKTQHSDQVSYTARQNIYDAQMEQVHQHNGNKLRLWTAGPTPLSDLTAKELKAHRGLSRVEKAGMASRIAGHEVSADLFQRGDSTTASCVDWSNLACLDPHNLQHQNQGACGSCWAFSASMTLECQASLHNGFNGTISREQILSCTPNPQQCGGTGGCEGATAQLAFQYILGADTIASNLDIPYLASEAHCVSRQYVPQSLGMNVSNDASGNDLHVMAELPTFQASSVKSGMIGYVNLRPNFAQEMKYYLANSGPVSISVAADNNWNMYTSGIMNSCDRIVNHAIVMVGYGAETVNDEDVGYWLALNSWGASWGENGYIRILRDLNDAVENANCGWDTDPEVGNACVGGDAQVPEAVWVCGTCGILSNSVVPLFDTKLSATAQSSGQGTCAPASQ